MKRENRDERTRITWNGGTLVAELTVAGGDGGVAAVADGGCCKKRKKGEEICRGWRWWQSRWLIRLLWRSRLVDMEVDRPVVVVVGNKAPNAFGRWPPNQPSICDLFLSTPLIGFKLLILFNFTHEELQFKPQISTHFSLWYLVLDLCNLTLNWSINFQFLQFDP